MKIKKILLLTLFILISMIVYSSETRLDGMGGISESGIFVVPDTWCDSFFVNPAYAMQTDKTIVNLDNSFKFQYFDIKTSTIDRDMLTGLYWNYYNYIPDKLTALNPAFSYGILLPLKKFTFGARLYFDYNYQKSHSSYFYTYDDIEELYKLDYILNRGYLGYDMLFSWQINKTVDFGISCGLTSVLYNVSEDDYYERCEDKDREDIDFDTEKNEERVPLDINLNASFGFTIKKEKFNFSISVPAAVILSQEYNKDQTTYKDIYPVSFINSKGVWSDRHDSIIFSISSISVFDIFASDVISLRIPIEAGFKYNNTTHPEWYDNYFLFSGTFDEYCMHIFDIYLKTAISVINNFHDRVLLFYGLYLAAFYERVEYGYDWENSRSNDFGYPDLGLFFGCEFNILKWFKLRTGLNAAIITYLYLLSNITFDIGFTFSPGEIVSIEIASQFLTSSLKTCLSNFESFNREFNNRSIEERLKEYSVKIDLALVFSIDREKVKQRKTE